MYLRNTSIMASSSFGPGLSLFLFLSEDDESEVIIFTCELQ